MRRLGISRIVGAMAVLTVVCIGVDVSPSPAGAASTVTSFAPTQGTRAR